MGMAIACGGTPLPPHQPNSGSCDSASCDATMEITYRAGASRARRRGDHSALLARAREMHGHSPTPRLRTAGSRLTWKHQSAARSKALRLGTESAPISSSRSEWTPREPAGSKRGGETMIVQSVKVIDSQGPMGASVGVEAPSSNEAESQSEMRVRQDNIEGIRSNNTVSSALGERHRRPANASCPFSHEPMDSTVALDLKCGHRFSLGQLATALRAAEICSSQRFAHSGHLICPLCGDQDETTRPPYTSQLTTYSSNCDACIGDLRKDCSQLPLTLPQQPSHSPALTPNRPKGVKSGKRGRVTLMGLRLGDS